MLSTKAAYGRLAIAASLVLAGVGPGCGGSSNGSNTASMTLTGDYGGIGTGTSLRPATLHLTASGGQLSLPCGGGDRFNQPLVTDQSGHFSITGTAYSGFPVLPVSRAMLRQVVLLGTANGDTLTLTDAATRQAIDTFTVVKG